MKKIIFLILVFTCTSLFSQEETPLKKFFYNKYKGKIGNKDVILELMKDDSVAGGFLYFNENKIPQQIDIESSTITFDKSFKFNIIDSYDSNGIVISNSYLLGKFLTNKVLDGLLIKKNDIASGEKFVFEEDLTDDFARINMHSVGLNHVISERNFKSELLINLPIAVNKDGKSYQKINEIIKSNFLISYSDSNDIKFTTIEQYVSNWYQLSNSYLYEILNDTTYVQNDSIYDILSMNWKSELNFFVEFNEAKILSLGKFVEEYSGGLHPVSANTYLNFDLETQDLLKLEDIIIPEKIIKVQEIAMDIFNEMEKIDSKSSLNDQGYWFENDRFYLPNNFAMRPNCLLFAFNPYEVSSFARGTIEIIIPYDKIKEFINKDSKLYKFINK